MAACSGSWAGPYLAYGGDRRPPQPFNTFLSAEQIRSLLRDTSLALLGQLDEEALVVIRGYEIVDYVLEAGKGQSMNVSMATDNLSSYFNILPPGESEVAMFIDSTNGSTRARFRRTETTKTAST